MFMLLLNCNYCVRLFNHILVYIHMLIHPIFFVFYIIYVSCTTYLYIEYYID